MVVFRPREVKLHEDAADVLLDSSFRDVEAVRDAVVGASFRHQSEHLSLSRRQFHEWIAASTRSDQLLNESGIDH